MLRRLWHHLVKLRARLVHRNRGPRFHRPTFDSLEDRTTPSASVLPHPPGLSVQAVIGPTILPAVPVVPDSVLVIERTARPRVFTERRFQADLHGFVEVVNLTGFGMTVRVQRAGRIIDIVHLSDHASLLFTPRARLGRSGGVGAGDLLASNQTHSGILTA